MLHGEGRLRVICVDAPGGRLRRCDWNDSDERRCQKRKKDDFHKTSLQNLPFSRRHRFLSNGVD
jgi:hypothetical protein